MVTGSYIAIKNNKVISSKDKKIWHNVDGHLIYKNNDEWNIIYLTETNNLVKIDYKNKQFTLSSKSQKLYSNDGINWIDKTA